MATSVRAPAAAGPAVPPYLNNMTKQIFAALTLCLIATTAVQSLAESEPMTPKIRVLIVDGFSNHDWKLTTQLIRAIIEPSGLFVVDVSTAPPTAGSG